MLNASSTNSTVLNGSSIGIIPGSTAGHFGMAALAMASLAISQSHCPAGTINTTGRIEAARIANASAAVNDSGGGAVSAIIRAYTESKGNVARGALIVPSLKAGGSADGRHTYTGNIMGRVWSHRVDGAYRHDGHASASVKYSAVSAGDYSYSASISTSVLFRVRSAGRFGLKRVEVNPQRVRHNAARGAVRFKYKIQRAMTYHPCSEGMYSYSGHADGVTERLFFKWTEGIAYRVIQDTSINGLEQGGIKRDGLMGTIQRLGL
jgi:hypothetical protein